MKDDVLALSDGIPGHLAEVGRYGQYERAAEHGLVVLSMGLAYWMFQREGQFCLYVERDRLAQVLRELELHERRRLRRRAVPPAVKPAAGRILLLIWALLLSGMFAAQEARPDRLLPAGRLDAVAVIGEGEVWRTVTALTLHLDIGHLAGNLVAGLFFGALGARAYGPGLSWLLILMSGMAGNLLTAASFYPADHFSAGASTAVFGALGLLAGGAAVGRMAVPHAAQGRRRLLPLAAGLVMLGLLGAGDARTDVLAHVFGFLCGAVLSLPGSWVAARIPDRGWQDPALGMLAGVIVTAAWMAA